MATRRSTYGLILLALLATPVPLLAGYRENQPPVMGERDLDEEAVKRKQSKVNPEQATNDFRTAYARAKQPRIAVFWNRALSDSVSSQWVATERVVIQDDATINGLVHGANNDAQQSRTVAISHEARVNPNAENRSGLGELEMARFEEGMLAIFSEAGCHLVDRSTIIRMTPASSGKAGGETLVESEALKQKADLLLEVLLIRDPGSSYGFAFRVSAKELKTGRILASVVHQASDQDAAGGEWVAGDNGFELKKDPSAFFNTQGQNAGAKAMQALARVL